MSTQPEEIENEIEEGEILVEDETESESEEELDDEELDDEDEDFGESVDIATLMTSLLATEEGDTICTTLVNIGQQLQTQNKILIKILSQLKN
jgi:hypothetical protein